MFCSVPSAVLHAMASYLGAVFPFVPIVRDKVHYNVKCIAFEMRTLLAELLVFQSTEKKCRRLPCPSSCKCPQGWKEDVWCRQKACWDNTCGITGRRRYWIHVVSLIWSLQHLNVETLRLELQLTTNNWRNVSFGCKIIDPLGTSSWSGWKGHSIIDARKYNVTA